MIDTHNIRNVRNNLNPYGFHNMHKMADNCVEKTYKEICDQ